jgi:hypothetical protein
MQRGPLRCQILNGVFFDVGFGYPAAPARCGLRLWSRDKLAGGPRIHIHRERETRRERRRGGGGGGGLERLGRLRDWLGNPTLMQLFTGCDGAHRYDAPGTDARPAKLIYRSAHRHASAYALTHAGQTCTGTYGARALHMHTNTRAQTHSRTHAHKTQTDTHTCARAYTRTHTNTHTQPAPFVVVLSLSLPMTLDAFNNAANLLVA